MLYAWHEPFCGNSPGAKMMISWKRPPLHTRTSTISTNPNQPISSSPPLAPSCCPATQRNSLPRLWLISGVPGLAYPQCLASSKQARVPAPTTNPPAPIRRMRGQGMTLCNVKPIQCVQCVLLLFEDHKECLNVPFVPLACCTCCLFAQRLWNEQWKQRICTWIGNPCRLGAQCFFVSQTKKCLTQSKCTFFFKKKTWNALQWFRGGTSNWWDWWEMTLKTWRRDDTATG